MPYDFHFLNVGHLMPIYLKKLEHLTETPSINKYRNYAVALTFQR